MIRKARFSRCRKYRYMLERIWDEAKPCALFIMLNPSKLDHQQDNPTIKRCVTFAQDLGFGSLYIGNLFAFKATQPSDLLLAEDPIGKRNLEYLKKAKKECETIITAWGVSQVVKKLQPITILQEIDQWKSYSLGFCKDGTPRHPLYLRKDAQLQKNKEPFVNLLK